MQTLTPTKQAEAAEGFQLVPAKTIARRLSVTPRYVHMLYDSGKIPGYRFGKACIRFNQAAVFAALGIQAEAAATAGAGQ